MSTGAPQLEPLLLQVTKSLENNELDLANQFLDKALKEFPQETRAWELKANLLLEQGEWEEAYKLFHKVLELSGSEGWPSAHMSLGQMTTDQESAQHFQHGINQYLAKVNKLSDDSSELLDIQRKIANGFIGLTELYLTDLCFEPDAELNCESYLKQAIEIDPTNPDAYQTLASVRLSQHRADDAKNNLIKSTGLWLNKNEVIPPPFENRLALARLLIESELYDLATQVLEHLQKEDDQNVETWYLFGLCSFLQGKEDNENQPDLDSWKDCVECFNSALMLAEREQYDDQDVLGHIQQLQSEMTAIYPELANYTPDQEQFQEHDLEFETDDEDAME